ncbi:uroporphyrinogen-III synthase [Neorhizobium sp. NPDC001467]|uniref:uroporphyrinogen-III synthase n=1 Tax=Neorhizobium sp. NPDC001467 TaxID=3390595 RepID=UPI003CFE3F62
MRVVVTRPLDRGQTTAATLRGMGHEPMLLPLSEARHLTDQIEKAIPAAFSTIAVTSAEALRALDTVDFSAHLTTPLYAVGRKTAAAARQAGFKTIAIAGGDGASLAALIARHAPTDVVYLTGRPRSPTFEAALREEDIRLAVIECYEMVPLQPSTDELQAFLAFTPAAILFHSRETARLFFELPVFFSGAQALQSCVIACLSARVAEVVPPSLQAQVKVARKPDEDSLLALL